MVPMYALTTSYTSLAAILLAAGMGEGNPAICGGFPAGKDEYLCMAGGRWAFLPFCSGGKDDISPFMVANTVLQFYIRLRRPFHGPDVSLGTSHPPATPNEAGK